MENAKGRAGSKIIRVEGVGDVLIERSGKARRICLSVKPFKGVRVAVPYGISFEQAEAVAQAKAPWIGKHLSRMAVLEQAAVDYNRRAPINRSVARRVIADRLEELAGQHGFTYAKVFVRNQKTRWGSCSAKNNINLNVHLIRLPSALRDYVILHELVHTRIKNHSPQFWEELEKHIANCKQVDRQLNQYDSMLLSNEPLKL